VRDGEFLTPESAFVSAWSLTFALYLLRMLPYGPMSAGAAGVLALGAGLVVVGIHIGRRLARRIPAPTRHVTLPEAWLWGYGATGLVGLAWYLWQVHQLTGIPALWQHGFQVRLALNHHRIPSTFLFVEFFCVITPLVAAATALTGRKIGVAAWVLAAACVAGTWAMTDRTQFFTTLLGLAFMYAYRRGEALGWGRLSMFVASAGALLLASFLIVGAFTGKSPAAMKLTLRPPLASSTSGDVEPGVLAGALRQGSTIYLYATASYAAFAVWYPEEQPLTYGLHTAYPFFRALQKAGLYSGRLPEHILPFVPILTEPIPLGWNGYTMLYYPLVDFGLPGMIVYCLLVGAFCGAAYQAVRAARTSPGHLLLAAQVTTGLVLSIFVNKFNNTAWWYLLLCSIAPFAITSVLARRRSAGRTTPQA